MSEIKVAITGGNGILGTYLLNEIITSSSIVPVVLSRSELKHMNFECIQTDYSYEGLVDILDGVDSVIHLASIRGTSSNIVDYLENVRVTENVYKACLKSGVSNIVYTSSIAVYSDETQLPWSEEIVPSPISAYGISKLCCENIGNLYNIKYNMCIKNLRLPPLYSVVSEKDQIVGRMINKFIIQALRKETLILEKESRAYREFLYVKDAVNAIICAMTHEQKKGTFNIGSNEIFNNKEIAELINEVFQNNNNLLVATNQFDNLASAYFNTQKATIELGYVPKYTMKSAMNEIYGEMKKCTKNL